VRVARTALAATLAATAVAGCGGGGDATTTTTERTTTTRVELLEQAARAPGGGRFDPQGIYRREAPGVVTVISTGLRARGRSQEGLGSGFVVSGAGEIATNAHVVTSGEGRDIQRAGQVYVRFADGNQVPATVRGFDPFSDVALLKVDPAGLRLRPLALGAARAVQVGAPVVAIGSPFGEAQSLSVGVVSAKNRSIQSLTGFDTTGALQTDAAINHGNSGGPLLDARGQVLGINSQIQTSTGDGSGVGFAVPVEAVRRSLAQLRADGRVRYAYLGVATVPVFPQLAEHFGLRTGQGAWVQTITGGGPSEDAGLRAGDGRERFQEREYIPGGDIVVALDGQPVRREDDLSRLLVAHRPGDTVGLTVVRGGERKRLTVRLGERPLDAPPSG
jgi:S1-C subfamily serine protease